MLSAVTSLRKFWGEGGPLEGGPSSIIVLARYVMRPQTADLMWAVLCLNTYLPDAKMPVGKNIREKNGSEVKCYDFDAELFSICS